MLVAGIILLILSIGGIIVLGIIDEDENALIKWMLGIVSLFGVFLIFAGVVKKDPIKKSMKDYSLKIETVSTIVNGKEVSRDTVYIFTPKK